MKNMFGNDQLMVLDDSLRGSGILPRLLDPSRLEGAPTRQLRFKSVPLALVSCPANNLPCRRVFSRLGALRLLPIAPL